MDTPEYLFAKLHPKTLFLELDIPSINFLLMYGKESALSVLTGIKKVMQSWLQYGMQKNSNKYTNVLQSIWKGSLLMFFYQIPAYTSMFVASPEVFTLEQEGTAFLQLQMLVLRLFCKQHWEADLL